MLTTSSMVPQGVGARQHDAWDLGMVSSDDFTNADVRYEQSFANIKRSLTRTGARPQEIPIVTGFLARGENTGRHLGLHLVTANTAHPPASHLCSSGTCLIEDSDHVQVGDLHL